MSANNEFKAFQARFWDEIRVGIREARRFVYNPCTVDQGGRVLKNVRASTSRWAEHGKALRAGNKQRGGQAAPFVHP